MLSIYNINMSDLDPNTNYVNGPVNVVRLEGKIGNIKKNLELQWAAPLKSLNKFITLAPQLTGNKRLYSGTSGNGSRPLQRPCWTRIADTIMTARKARTISSQHLNIRTDNKKSEYYLFDYQHEPIRLFQLSRCGKPTFLEAHACINQPMRL